MLVQGITMKKYNATLYVTSESYSVLYHYTKLLDSACGMCLYIRTSFLNKCTRFSGWLDPYRDSDNWHITYFPAVLDGIFCWASFVFDAGRQALLLSRAEYPAVLRLTVVDSDGGALRDVDSVNNPLFVFRRRSVYSMQVGR